MPKSINTGTNKPLRKNALRTKRWIADALVELMKTKNYNSITVKEIVSKADVSRQSFYRHFSTKEDVVYYYVDTNIVTDFQSRFKNLNTYNLEDILTLYFEFWQDKIGLLRMTIKSNYPIHMIDKYEKLLKFQLSGSFYSIVNELNINTPKEMDIVLSFIIGGLFNIKTHWAKSELNYSPKELAATVAKLIAPK